MGNVRISARLKAKLKQRTRPYVMSRLFREVFMNSDYYKETGVRHEDVENRPYNGGSPEVIAAERHAAEIRTVDFEPKILPAAQLHVLLVDPNESARTYPEHERGYER